MNTTHYNQLFSYIWNIATDVLVYKFEKSEYKKIIMPFMVLRRIDVLLEPTKEAVLAKKAFCDSVGITEYAPFMTVVTGYPFYNTSEFTLQKLKSETDPQKLRLNFIDYLNGYCADVQDIVDKFKLRQMVDNLTDVGCLGSIIDKFTDENYNLSVKPVMKEEKNEDGTVKLVERLPGLDNHTMGTLFEELLRRFNEENQVTEAGEHFTPRDYVKLLAQLAIEPIADQIIDNTYSIYDGACGTGGILTIAQEEMNRIAKEKGKNINIQIYGQELQPDTYATCKADLMISGNINSFSYKLYGSEHQFISYGSTISQDGHAGETFDFCISNPPFGTPWKTDLQNKGIDEKKPKKFTDPRFWNGSEDFLPAVDDCQMLFLANNLSRMKDTPMGTRIVEVHNGSSLYTGNAGKGASNLRKYIIENDLLEAVIAMPENDFYNTIMGTYIWIVTNRKESRRKGKVQLIDATAIHHPLRKNLGEKNCETNEEDRRAIMKLLLDFKETPQSKIFHNAEFGYWEVGLERPVLDENGNVVRDKKGNVKYVKVKNEVEQIPLLYPGGISAFYENEVKPYDPDVRFLEPVVGYELSFTKYFYRPKKLRTLAEISADIKEIEERTDGMLNDILGL